MAKRARIGLIFSYTEEWIAGTYYILNIINALHKLPRKKQPVILVITDNPNNYDFVKKETQYSFLELFQYPFVPVTYNIFERGINKIFRCVGVKKLIKKTQKQPKIDFLYPNVIDKIKIKGLKRVNWIPDFQEEFLPQFFSKKEIDFRKKYQKEVVCEGDYVVFSSKDAHSHFLKLYPESRAKSHVLPFTVSHPDFSDLDILTLRKKYQLPKAYFFVPNQFWAHKNHKVVLEAVRNLKQKGTNLVVAFSGKQNDYRNSDYVSSLKSYINQWELTDNIRFLGFLDRKEQLSLMRHSLAIVQPSLFEGWSTVVEDAKALNKYIILSNLPVHQEQIKVGVTFFEPESVTMLAQILKINFNTPRDTTNYEYDKERINFGLRFMELVYLASK